MGRSLYRWHEVFAHRRVRSLTNTDPEMHRSDWVPTVGLPGQSAIQTGMTNTKNTPIEAFERAYPMRVQRLTIRRESGGAGLAPGGDGMVKEIEVLEDCTVSLITERRTSRPWGLWGGDAGAPGENWLVHGGDETRAERLPDKCTVRLKAGDVLRVMTPGGGGWGSAPAPG